MRTVISELAVISCLGSQTGSFVSGIRDGRHGHTETPDGPTARVAVVPGLADDPDFAATKRARLTERSSSLAVGTIAKLLARAGLAGRPGEDTHDTAIVLGSATASIESFMTITRASLEGTKPYFVDHKQIPACAMNYTSSQAAIRFDIRGPNVTVTAGRVTGLTALTYGRRLIGAGRARVALCGAFDAVTQRRLRIGLAAGTLDTSTTPGEGCCVFLLETAGSAEHAGRQVRAELLATAAGCFAVPGACGDVLGRTVTRALRRARVTESEIGLVVPCGPGHGPLAETEDDVLGALLPGARVLDPAVAVGDTDGAAAAFGVAAAITGGTARDGIALVTSVDPDGHVGCAVLSR